MCCVYYSSSLVVWLVIVIMSQSDWDKMIQFDCSILLSENVVSILNFKRVFCAHFVC